MSKRNQTTQEQFQSKYRPARTERVRTSGKGVNFGDRHVARATFATPRFAFTPGTLHQTLDGRAARVAWCSTILPGYAWLTSGDDGFLVNPDGRAYDRKDTLQGFKPKAAA